jgi:hypothetical protein
MSNCLQTASLNVGVCVGPKSRQHDLIGIKKRIERVQWMEGGPPAALIEAQQVLLSHLHVPCAALREKVEKERRKMRDLFCFE